MRPARYKGSDQWAVELGGLLPNLHRRRKIVRLARKHLQRRGRVQILDIDLAEDAEGRAVGCHLQSTGQLLVFYFQSGAQLDELHGEIVSTRIYFELAV